MEPITEEQRIAAEEQQAAIEQARKDPLHPYGNPCAVCGSEHDEENWGVLGWIGILPLSLCADCSQGMVSMVLDHMPVEELEEAVMIRKAAEAAEMAEIAEVSKPE
jgi:hypothetical protein